MKMMLNKVMGKSYCLMRWHENTPMPIGSGGGSGCSHKKNCGTTKPRENAGDIMFMKQ